MYLIYLEESNKCLWVLNIDIQKLKKTINYISYTMIDYIEFNEFIYLNELYSIFVIFLSVYLILW
jgi:5-methylcytosine-specific restriction endonuclease McrBC GTP-binding regulatory subunit McrB